MYIFKNNVLIKKVFITELYKAKNHHAHLTQKSTQYPDYLIDIEIKLIKKSSDE